MQNNESVLCPMGHEMELFQVASGGWRYGCVACATSYKVLRGKRHGWISPIRSTKKLAYEAAVKRPLQKPLTLAEAKAMNMERKPLYVESNFVDRWHSVQPLNGWVVGLGWMRSWGKPDDKPVGFLEEGYGTYWRCWATKPTDEERSAAKWE